MDNASERERSGKVRAIGVCNFTVEQMKRLMREFPDDPPLVNQIELHPYLQQKELVAFCRQAGIAIIEAGVARGDIDATLDAGLAMDLILGAIFLRLLLRHAPLDASTAQAAIDAIVPAR